MLRIDPMSKTAVKLPVDLAPELSDAKQAAILQTIAQIPVMQSNLGMVVDSLREGQCVATAPRHKQYDGFFECYHGGLLMMIADTIACYAVMTLTGPQQKMATTDMNIRFLAPCLTELTVVATVIKPGKILNPVHVDLYDTDSKKVAVAQVTYMLLDKIPSRDR